ncbi:phosphoribosyltransferase [Sporomusa acidovorans]|uniref:Phosphoribosyl transferase n=1 Tax=Sporomusa acidovorans (strain ATCC 49682 / DSM 3132 / Mol) TaxID=1123286 RepID=A0ABZ3JAW8_SPOA4|nr:phosphoribosyltransferase family protein [Sporomusa acidovorans]OZC22718.1 putative phosphoribosyl transferasec [Sporomusa acidovorans DSM 3132]SDE79706.1 Predicted phosphoribosyltransferase [Sporomusa acidovorans]
MFDNRTHAGQLLAEKLAARNLKNPYILAVPRGGLAVASPIAAKLQANVAVLIAKKIGHPLNAEVAIGAIMPDGSLIHDNQYVSSIGVKQENFDKLTAEARKVFDQRVKVYEAMIIKNQEVKGRDIIVVDDGIATGYTIRAAVKWLQKWNPASITVAVPVAPTDITQKLREVQVEVVCLDERDVFTAVGSYYKDFKEMTDQEALEYHRFSPNSIVRL